MTTPTDPDRPGPAAAAEAAHEGPPSDDTSDGRECTGPAHFPQLGVGAEDGPRYVDSAFAAALRARLPGTEHRFAAASATLDLALQQNACDRDSPPRGHLPKACAAQAARPYPGADAVTRDSSPADVQTYIANQ